MARGPMVVRGKHVTTRYEENHKSFGAFLMSEQALKPVRQVSVAMTAAMVVDAPYDASRPASEGPHYRDSFDVGRGPGVMTFKRYPNPRPFMRISNDARHAAPIEFGANARPGQSVMRGAGLKYGNLSTGWS